MAIDTSSAQRFADGIAQQRSQRHTTVGLDDRQRLPDALRAQPGDAHQLPLFPLSVPHDPRPFPGPCSEASAIT